jgi:hypothetical protein
MNKLLWLISRYNYRVCREVLTRVMKTLRIAGIWADILA